MPLCICVGIGEALAGLCVLCLIALKKIVKRRKRG